MVSNGFKRTKNGKESVKTCRLQKIQRTNDFERHKETEKSEKETVREIEIQTMTHSQRE